jgi:hypothetical protein
MELDEHRQQIFKSLVDSAERLAGGGEIAVAEGVGSEIAIRRLKTPVATCTVGLLTGEPTFHAHFAFSNLTAGPLSFTISKRDFDRLGIETTTSFDSGDEAVKWLLNMLAKGSTVY